MRCLSGGVCLSLAVLTFGFQGLAGSVSYIAPSALPATGVVGPGTLDPGQDVPSTSTSAPGTPSASAVPGGFTADALALVAFSRSTVETASKDGVGGELNVASAGLKRPPIGSLMAPLETLVPSSPYGLRTSPLTGATGEFHWGQDYAAACGTRVYAADAGVVRAVGWHPWGGGNRVEIDHGNGLITTYNHLEAIAVKKGDSVRVGEVIARVGTTGNSTGCHLHFETILNGAHTDPLHWSMIPISQVDPLGPIEMTSYAPGRRQCIERQPGLGHPGPDGSHACGGRRCTGAADCPAGCGCVGCGNGSGRCRPAVPGATLTAGHAQRDAAADCSPDDAGRAQRDAARHRRRRRATPTPPPTEATVTPPRHADVDADRAGRAGGRAAAATPRRRPPPGRP